MVRDGICCSFIWTVFACLYTCACLIRRSLAINMRSRRSRITMLKLCYDGTKRVTFTGARDAIVTQPFSFVFSRKKNTRGTHSRDTNRRRRFVPCPCNIPEKRQKISIFFGMNVRRSSVYRLLLSGDYS